MQGLILFVTFVNLFTSVAEEKIVDVRRIWQFMKHFICMPIGTFFMLYFLFLIDDIEL